MKKLLFLSVGFLSLTSCVNEIQTNTPALEAKLNNEIWRGKQAYVDVVNGGLVITAFTLTESIVLKTSSTNPGAYFLGTTNENNFISYTIESAGVRSDYDTYIYPGPVYKISNIVAAGTGYSTTTNVETTGGSGSGLKLDIVANGTGGVIDVTIVARGGGYKAGDVVNIVGEISNNARVKILNVQQSNGEIVIKELENGAFTGTFKFNAVDRSTGEVVTFSDGIFYKLSSAGL